jgi:hypothetical protein
MKVKVLVSVGFVDPVDPTKTHSPTPGAVSDLPDVVAEEFIRIGFAEAVDQKTPVDELPDEGIPAVKAEKKKKTLTE